MNLESFKATLSASQEIFEAMDDRGADLDAVHTIDHLFLSADRAVLEEVGKAAEFLGFGLGDIQEIPRDGKVYCSLTVQSRTPILSEDFDVYIPASREAIVMLAIAEVHGAKYDGWGTKMIKKSD